MKNVKQFDSETTDWQQHIDNYCNGEQSKTVYCAEQDLNVKQFEYHYRRWYENLKEERESANNPTPAEFSRVILTPVPTVTSTPLTSATNKPSDSSIELQLANGVRCKVKANFCKVTLKQLMELVL